MIFSFLRWSHLYHVQVWLVVHLAVVPTVPDIARAKQATAGSVFRDLSTTSRWWFLQVLDTHPCLKEMSLAAAHLVPTPKTPNPKTNVHWLHTATQIRVSGYDHLPLPGPLGLDQLLLTSQVELAALQGMHCTFTFSISALKYNLAASEDCKNNQ